MILLVEAIPTPPIGAPAFALLRVAPSALATFRTPPYERKDDALNQYSYCLSVESGLPNVLIKSCSVVLVLVATPVIIPLTYQFSVAVVPIPAVVPLYAQVTPDPIAKPNLFRSTVENPTV